ncbi:uronyl 2-sulfotransferase-like [Diadema setosum]|uniref:uronyl 2-sulfotransferase-like n=1 Tax=Diadema setosum TaxID=31175 RepID=UPI003B3B8226
MTTALCPWKRRTRSAWRVCRGDKVVLRPANHGSVNGEGEGNPGQRIRQRLNRRRLWSLDPVVVKMEWRRKRVCFVVALALFGIGFLIEVQRFSPTTLWTQPFAFGQERSALPGRDINSNVTSGGLTVTNATFGKRVFGKTREKAGLIDLIKEQRPGAFCKGHTSFYHFTNLTGGTPVYINMIRDPVERMVSAFYFTRYGDKSIPKTVEDQTQRIMSIEDCIRSRHYSCTAPKIFPKFCGYQPECWSDSNRRWGLRTAISNVKRYYTFVGIVEEYENSLLLLEKLMPDMFGGLLETYHTPTKSGKNTSAETKTINKQPISPELVQIAREYMKEDYEFYDFIYSAFQRLKKRYNIG